VETAYAQMEKVDRLYAVTQRIGFTLWQIQELESCAAQYFVLVAKAHKGMGSKAGYELLDKALGKTFGATIHAMCQAGLLSSELEAEFRSLLMDRNWLVHKSRSTNRNVIHSDTAAVAFIERLDAMIDHSNSLMEKVLKLTEEHITGLGITQQQIDTEAVRILDEWHGPNTI